MNVSPQFGLVFIFSLLLAGCTGLNEQQKTWLREGERAYQRDENDRAIQNLTSFLDSAGDQPEGDRALYVRGLAYACAGRRPPAYADLRRCIDSSRDAEIKWRAAVALGSLCFEDGDWRAAAGNYAAALTTMPQTPPRDLVLFRIGQCNQRMGRWSAALESCQQLVSAFPRGEWSESARRVLEFKPGGFYIQSGVFGQQKNAENQAVTLQRAGFTTTMRPEVRNSRSVYVVLVGPYGAFAQARGEWGKVRAYAPDSVIWP